MAEIVIAEADHGGTRSVKVGDTLVLELPETPTSGFCWTPAVADANILELKADEFRLATPSGVGGGGLRMFRFLAKSPGHISLQFQLRRSWESHPPKAVFKLEVTVNGGAGGPPFH